MKRMRKCNDEIYQLAKDQVLVKIYKYIYIPEKQTYQKRRKEGIIAKIYQSFFILCH
jgi:hypothetical protein